MSFQCRILACLALGLTFTTQNLGIYVFMLLYRLPSLQTHLIIIAIHSAGMLICAFLLPFLLARGRGFLSPLPLLMALTVPIILASHIPPWQDGMFAFSLRVICVSIFWLLALYAFFQVTPPRCRGLLLGLLIAVAELIWLALLPAMHSLVSTLPEQTLLGFLYKLQIVVQCSIGLVLAAFFALAGKEDQSSPACSNKTQPPFVLPLLFVAVALFYIAYGFVSGQGTPKVSRTAISENAHIAILLTMPLAGTLLDRSGRMLLAVLACLVLIAPAMLFARDETTREALYIAYYVGRQGVFLATLVLAPRLMRNSKRLPFSFAFAYAMMVFAPLVGSAIARVLENAVLKDTLAIIFALAAALLLLRLRLALFGMPLAGEEDSPTPRPDLPITPDPGRLAAFAITYGLSGQEIFVMEMLVQRHPTQDIAKSMNVMESTVRNYVARMLKKTAVPNRAALMALFAAQNPVPPEAAEQGAKKHLQ